MKALNLCRRSVLGTAGAKPVEVVHRAMAAPNGLGGANGAGDVVLGSGYRIAY